MEASQSLTTRAREAARRTDRTALIVLVLGTLGGLALILTEFATIFQVDPLTSGTCEELSDRAIRDKCRAEGLEQHSGALLLLGALAIFMALGASRGGSRPAAAALVAIGCVVLAIALLLDLPKTNEDGLLEPFYESGAASAGTGFWFELAGAGLCAAAGALRLARGGRPYSDTQPER